MELVIKHFSELTTEELYEILKIRIDVFVVEQNSPYRDIDDKDKDAYHLYLKDEDGIAAYLRALAAGISFEEPSLGRIVATRRGKGYGKEIVCAGIKFVRQKFSADKIKIEAQTYAKGFYEKLGFRQCSEEFVEDGIPHILMVLDCSTC